VVNFDIKMRAHGLLEVPISICVSSKGRIFSCLEHYFVLHNGLHTYRYLLYSEGFPDALPSFQVFSNS
jgi:hypothetical protein